MGHPICFLGTTSTKSWTGGGDGLFACAQHFAAGDQVTQQEEQEQEMQQKQRQAAAVGELLPDGSGR